MERTMTANWSAPIRLDKKNAGGFAVREPGAYSGRLYNVEPRDSQAGNPTLKVELNLDAGGKQFDQVTITEKTLFRVRQFLLATGTDETLLDADDLTPQRVVELARQNLGSPVVVNLGIEPASDQYEAKNKVSKYIHPDAAPVNTVGQGGVAASTGSGW
jgi:hypothetical protein